MVRGTRAMGIVLLVGALAACSSSAKEGAPASSSSTSRPAAATAAAPNCKPEPRAQARRDEGRGDCE